MNSICNHKGRLFSENSDEAVELDVTPVMNVFIILIPFLISVAVFTHLTILDISVPPGIASAAANKTSEKPKLRVTVVLHENYLAITLGEKLLDSIPTENGRYLLDKFGEKLRSAAEQTQLANEAVVAVSDRVKFKHIIEVMDRCRENGFSKISLSSATSHATEHGL